MIRMKINDNFYCSEVRFTIIFSFMAGCLRKLQLFIFIFFSRIKSLVENYSYDVWSQRRDFRQKLLKVNHEVANFGRN